MSDRPNIMLLVGEDTGRHQGCYGETYAHTPNIDRLAAEGCRYTNAFTHTPVCAPSRSGLVTGQLPFSYGAHLMRCKVNDPPRLLTHELQDAGYATHWPTKTDFNFDPPDDFAITEPNWFTEQRLPDAPFFVYQNFDITHESCVWDIPNWHGQTHAVRVEALPSELRHDPAEAPVPPYLPDTAEVREEIARYHDCLTVQDMQVGKALDLLERSGQAENTIVIYLTDHGRGLPREKRWCYDAGVHLPLIIRWPDHLQPGSTCEDLVGWIDVAPTLLSLIGAPIPERFQGRVFLGDGRDEPRAYYVGGRDRMDEQFDRVRFARSKRWHYIRNDFPQLPYMRRNRYMEQGRSTQSLRQQWAQGKLDAHQMQFMADHKPAEELYDAEADPDMFHNLADDPAHAEVLESHREALRSTLETTGDLGMTTEEVLVEQGLIEDHLEQYHGWYEPLPEKYRIGDVDGVVTAREAEQALADK